MKTRMAHLPYHKTLDQFDFSFQPSIEERSIRYLATLRFVEHQENLIFLGPTVYFTTAHDLVRMLQQAHHSNTVAPEDEGAD